MASSSSSSDMSFWIKFFKDAGIPAGDAANYAVVFSDNRITRTMLMDLNKEYLNDMGISILGDVISILKHAKTVFNQDARDRALQGSSEIRESSVLKKSTPASRTIAHHIGLERSASPTLTPSSKISKALSARLGNPVPNTEGHTPVVVKLGNVQKEEVPVPKKRRVFPEHEGPYKITMPKGTTAKTQKIMEEKKLLKAKEGRKASPVQGKTSVFSRLGAETQKASTLSPSQAQPSFTITGLGNIDISSPGQSSVFSRLGGKSTVKRAATSTVVLSDDEFDDDDDDESQELEYAGVLKASPSKKPKVEMSKNVMTRINVKDAKAVCAIQTEGVLSGGSYDKVKTIKSRLGPKMDEVSSTTMPSQSRTTQPRISLKKKGIGHSDNSAMELTVTVDSPTKSAEGNVGVFRRLGKAK